MRRTTFKLLSMAHRLNHSSAWTLMELMLRLQIDMGAKKKPLPSHGLPHDRANMDGKTQQTALD